MSEIETAEEFLLRLKAEGEASVDLDDDEESFPWFAARVRERDAAITRRALLDAAKDCERQAEQRYAGAVLRLQAKRLRLMAEGKGAP